MIQKKIFLNYVALHYYSTARIKGDRFHWLMEGHVTHPIIIQGTWSKSMLQNIIHKKHLYLCTCKSHSSHDLLCILDSRLLTLTNYFQCKKKKETNKKVKVLPVSAYLGQHITDIVISLLDIFNASGLVLVSIPAILNNGEAQIKPLTQLQQMVRLLARPVVVMEMLLILQVRVGRHINSLLQMIASQNE